MRRIVVLALLLGASVAAQAAEIKNIRLWSAPDQTRLVFDIDQSITYRLFQLTNPDRVVIDFSNTRISKAVKTAEVTNNVVTSLRTGVRKGSDLRIVLDTKTKVATKGFLLPPYERYGHRLVLDMNYEALSEVEQTSADVPVTSVETPAPPAPVVPNQPSEKAREIVIAIDAGHGGEDPGALGRKGTYEKDVVLAIAKKLEQQIARESGMRAVMVRKGDYYVSLRKRTELARQAQADLLVSIHADSNNNPRAHGASVYALSAKGASSEAATWLAEKENASDLIGGVSLDDKDDVLASVLLDLSQTATIEASLRVGKAVLSAMKQSQKMHLNRVEQAGFVVLKSPDIPSILVETAFISNPLEERKLRDGNYQSQMASAIMAGIRDYFKEHAPPGTVLARRGDYIVQPGDTLTAIASQFQLDVSHLRRANNLIDDLVRVGQVLRIPSLIDG